jgi:hypothetical protein
MRSSKFTLMTLLAVLHGIYFMEEATCYLSYLFRCAASNKPLWLSDEIKIVKP